MRYSAELGNSGLIMNADLPADSGPPSKGF